jgi:hypothetical protein
MSTAQELRDCASSLLYRAECTRRVRLLRCAASVLRCVVVKSDARGAAVRLREILLSPARPCERALRISQVQQRYPVVPVYVQNVSTPAGPGSGQILVRATARHRIGQPVLSFANVQKLKPVKNNFIVYFSSICQYFSSGCADDTGLYAPKMSVHLPDPGPSRSSGRATARQRIRQPVLLFAKVQPKKSVKNDFIVYFSDVCR